MLGDSGDDVTEDDIDSGKSRGSAQLHKAGKDGNAQPLIDWYNDGAGGQISWGDDGDFDQCVDVASNYMDVDQAHGFCQLRHMDATGETTSEHAAESKVVKHRLPNHLVGTVGPDDVILGPDGSYVVKAVDGGWAELAPV